MALVVRASLPGQVRRRKETWARFLGWEDRLEGVHGSPLHYSCQESPMNGGAGWPTVHRVTQSRTRLKQFSTHALHRTIILGESDSTNSSSSQPALCGGLKDQQLRVLSSFQRKEREVLT